MKRWRCAVCGQVFEGDTPPVPCPVCGADENAFELLDEAPTRWKCTVCSHIFEGEAPPVPCPICGADASAFIKIDAAETSFRKDTDDSFVIIGAGTAGLEAARAIRKRNATARITLVGKENHLPYNRPGLSQVLADNLSFVNLLLEDPDFYPANHIDVLSGVQAASVDLAAKKVALSNGSSLSFTKLLLATGARPFNPIQHGEDSIPVKVLRSYEDALEIANFAKGKRVVLVGGGILGLEAAAALRGRGAIVTVVEFSPRILPLQTDEAVASMLTQRLEKLGIGLLCGASVTQATQHGVVLSDGANMAADMVLASMGVRSDVELATAMGLELNRGIKVDPFMHTNHPDVWAAGDCAEFEGRVLAMAGAASSMGTVAGASMAGEEDTPYQTFVPATAFELPGLSLFSAGAVNQDAKESLLYQNAQSGQYGRLFFESGRLSGALYAGKNPGAKVLQALAAKASVADALPLSIP